MLPPILFIQVGLTDFFFLGIVDFQCYASLCYIAKLYTYIHFKIYILFHDGLSQETGYSPMCCAAGPCRLSILNVIVCIYQP